MIKRHLEAKLVQAADSYRVLSVTGPRQSGKTTLVRQVFKDARYVSLESAIRCIPKSLSCLWQRLGKNGNMSSI